MFDPDNQVFQDPLLRQLYEAEATEEDWYWPEDFAGPEYFMYLALQKLEERK